jgi:hypothetical protein
MKRIILMFAVAAVFAAMMMVSAIGAFAQPSGCTNPGCENHQRSTDTSPSQGNSPQNAEEPFTLQTTTTGEGQGTQPPQNPHTTTDTACFNNSGTHEFSDTSHCT